MIIPVNLPSITVVVPSYNQAQFLEETLCSILDQSYPRLELIVIDGGSTDGSLEIIRKYAEHIDYWVSEPDRGQSHAINKGLTKANGEWVGWLNSDDCYLAGALKEVFTNRPLDALEFIYGYCTVGVNSEVAIAKKPVPDTRESLNKLLHFFFSSHHIIPSNAAFVRRQLLDKVGLLDEKLHYCMDLDWFARIFLATKHMAHLPIPIGFYRIHSNTKTSSQQSKMQQEARQIAFKYSSFLPPKQRWLIKRKINYKEKLALLMEKQMTSLLKLVALALKYPEAAAIDPRIKILISQNLNGIRNKPASV